jgi:hypothetical protein
VGEGGASIISAWLQWRGRSCVFLLLVFLLSLSPPPGRRASPPFCLLSRCCGEALLAARDGGRATCCPGISPTATPCAQQQALKALCALRFAALSGLYPLSSVIPSPQYIVALYCIASYCARAPREPALGACGSPLSSMALSNSISNQAASSPRLCLCIAMLGPHVSVRPQSPCIAPLLYVSELQSLHIPTYQSPSPCIALAGLPTASLEASSASGSTKA